MPDDFDYEWLAWLMGHPEEWSADDLAAAEHLIASQQRAIDDSHPHDMRGRQSKQAVVDGLEAAIHAYLGRHARW